MTSVKASVAGLGILGVVSGGLYAGGVFTKGETPWRPLAEDSEFAAAKTEDPYYGKYSSRYAYYLLGTGKPKEGSVDNTYWWDFIYETRYKGKAPTNDGFVGLTSGSGETNSIKSACAQAYKGMNASGKISFSGNGGANKTFSEDNVWKYCSIGGTKIKTINEAGNGAQSGYDQNSYGKEAATKNNKLLVATKGYDNDWFWNLKEKEILESEQYPVPTEGTGELQDNEFKKLWKDNKGSYFKNRFLVKNKCEEAYKQAATSNTNYPSQDLNKFCSFKEVSKAITVPNADALKSVTQQGSQNSAT